MGFKTMDDIIAEVKNTTNESSVLDGTIDSVQATLQKMNKEKPISVETLKYLLEKEKTGKNRSTITRWLKHGIDNECLPNEYYLDYMATMGIYKSALQKYIRRSNVDKTIRAALNLFKMNRNSLENRLRTIICEDAFYSISLFPKVSADPIGVAYTLALNQKDSYCYRLAEHVIMNDMNKSYDGIASLRYGFFKDDIDTVLSAISYLRRNKRFDEFKTLYSSFSSSHPSDIYFEILAEVSEDEKWDGDIRLAAFLRTTRETRVTLTTPSTMDTLGVLPLELNEIDWYVFDGHTFPGTVALNIMQKKGYDRKKVDWAVWTASASIRDNEVTPPEYLARFYNGIAIKSFLKYWREIELVYMDTLFHVLNDLFKLGIKNE